jgi:type IV secretory pathway VirB2 component (pilin)
MGLQKYDQKEYRFFSTMLFLALFFLFVSDISFAQATDTNPFENAATGVLDWFTGPILTTIATIALTFVFMLCLFNVVSWRWFALIVIGTVGMFAAPNLVTTMQAFNS